MAQPDSTTDAKTKTDAEPETAEGVPTPRPKRSPEEVRAALDQARHSLIANVDAISAPELVYPEAIYLHNGETYLVRELDLLGKIAYVERRETDYYTQAVLESNVRITGGSQLLGAPERFLGAVEQRLAA